MQLNEPAEYEADVVIIDFGSAGGCAAIEARDYSGCIPARFAIAVHFTTSF